jgi:hypothetical protein
VFYDASRKLILKGVDGVVFVADSQVERMEANMESFENLRTNLGEQGYDLNKIRAWSSTTSGPPERGHDRGAACLGESAYGPRVPGGRPDRGRCLRQHLKAVAKLVLTELKKGG